MSEDIERYPASLVDATFKAAGSPKPGEATFTATGPPDGAPAQALEPEGEPPPPIPPLSAGATIKHYEIIRSLGQGGMGQVYLARDTKLGRLVAIKRLLDRGGVGARRLLREAQATAHCKHENIVVVYEADEHEGEPYLVLEYVEGHTLRAWLGRRAWSAESKGAAAPGRVPPSQALELMVPVVRALVCAHGQGIVHRDLKPENILLADAGPVKVLDFGIAKRLRLEASSTGVGADLGDKSGQQGTLLYMAPEQWWGEEADARIDLWAVGIMLYELCAGSHPLAPLNPSRLARLVDPSEPMPPFRERCPEAGALGAIVDRCLQKRKEARFGSARELLAALEALREGRAALAEGASPFPGLSAFQEADAGRFFGRDADVASVARVLRNQPLLAVVGPSGAGKSSFVRAGLIPALKRSGERWEAFVVRPGRRPLGALAEVLAQATEGSPEDKGAASTTELAATLREQPGQLGARLRARCRRRQGRTLLFVDQFEELYTLEVEAGERAAFQACLDGAADDASSPLRVVLSLRSDFVDRLAEDRKLLAEAARGLALLTPVGRDGLREALVRPLEGFGYGFESDAMVEQLLDELEGTRCPLPILQFAATKLWEARDDGHRLLTRASYERLGGVAGALSGHADAMLEALPTAEQRLCREVLLQLVTPERTRAVVSLDELRGLGAGGERGAVEAVVQRLVEARLLSLETGRAGETATVELVHESLIERWPQLGRWLDESAQDAQFLSRLRIAARQWEASGGAEGLLWRDRAAVEAQTWLERRRAEWGGRGAGLGEREGRFLRAVVALSEQSRRLRRWAVVGLIAALSAVALTVSYLAVRAQREALRAQAEARQTRNATRLAVARELQQSDPTAALAFLREVEPPGVPRGWADLARVALQNRVSELVLPHPDRVLSAKFSPDGKRLVTACLDKVARVWDTDGRREPLVLRGHEDAVASVAFSPDGRRLATASRDKTVRLWNADGAGEPLLLRGHEARVTSVTFSPDGHRLATASADRTVRLWSTDGTGEPLILRGHEATVYSPAFSPDGKRLVTASEDKTLRVWNTDGRGEPLVLRGHAEWVFSAAFSPDGRRIVSTSGDGTARVWDADGAGEPLVLRGHEGVVTSAAFSPDGRYVVTGSEDRTLRVWDPNGQGELSVLRGHEGWVASVAFSPDGRRIISSSWDHTSRVWNAEGTRASLALRGHDGAVLTVAFSPDGRHIITGGQDDTARVWNADGTGEPLVLRGHQDPVRWAAFRPDGKRLVTASEDKTLRVWDADGAGEPLVLRGHELALTSASLSPDGRRLVSSSLDKTARVWNADGTGEPLVLRGHEGPVHSAAFSPDGRLVVTGSEDKTARVWNADGTGEPLVLRGHQSDVWSAAFSPDGKRVVTASWDKTVRVWDAEGRGEPLVLRGHEGWVFSAAFSPDGRRLVTASQDKTVRVWDAEGRGEPLVLRGHKLPVTSVAFSPDGKRLVSGSWDKTLRVWDDLEPLRGPEDPTLWTATSYCPSVEQRGELLHVPEAQARADEQTCQRHVEAARAAVATPR